MWILIALLGDAMLAGVGIIDKLILAKSISKPIIFVFYSTIFVLALLLLLPFGVIFPRAWMDYGVFVLSGLCFALALWAMYLGLQKSEVSHLGPLIGAVISLFILVLSRIFLGEQLGSYGLLAIAFLVAGSLVISYDSKTQNRSGYKAVAWGVLAGFLFAISHVTSKYAYGAYGFYSGFVLTKLPIGIFGACLLISSDVRGIFGKKAVSTESAKEKNRKGLFLVAGSTGLGVIGATLVQYATALGSVSIVNALAGAQYALLIIFVAIISKFFPKILKETFTAKEIIQKTAAVTLIAVGLGLLFIK